MRSGLPVVWCLAAALSGCVAESGEVVVDEAVVEEPQPPENRPPQFNWFITGAGAMEPADVEVELILSDPDLEPVNYHLVLQPSGAGYSGAHVARDGEYAALNFSFSSLSAGRYTLVVAAWDVGTGVVDDQSFIVESAEPLVLFRERGNVTEACTRCTMSPDYSRNVTFGADGCVGYWRDTYGRDCFWFKVPKEMSGLPFVASSSEIDVDLEFRDSCVRGTSNSIEKHYEVNGDEHGIVPTGTRCAILWETDRVPAMLTFEVFFDG